MGRLVWMFLRGWISKDSNIETPMKIWKSEFLCLGKGKLHGILVLPKKSDFGSIPVLWGAGARLGTVIFQVFAVIAQCASGINHKMRKNCHYSNKNALTKKNLQPKFFLICTYLVYAYFMIFHSYSSLRHTGHPQQIPEISPYLAVNGTQSSTSPPQHWDLSKITFFW